MKKKRIAVVIVVIILIIGGYFFWEKNVKQNSDGKIKIGAILPLTGPGAIYGADLKKGIELAYEQSEIKDKIQTYYEDDAALPKTGVNALNNLILKKVDIVIGGVMSSVANSLLPIVNNNKVLLLSPKATDPKLSKNDYFFRVWPNDNVDGKVSASYIMDTLKLKRVAVFYPNVDYGVGINKVFSEEIEKKGGQIVYSEGYDGASSDFRTQLEKIKATKPDVLFLPSYIKELITIFKQLNELDCDFYIAGVSSYYEKNVQINAAKLVDKTFFTYPLYSAESEDPIVVPFVNAFKAKYNSAPNAFSAAGYDSFKLLETTIIELQKTGKEINADNLKVYFESMEKYKGVTGELSFDQYGDAIKDMRVIWLKKI